MGRLVVVCGLPGSGKTTLARRRAAELGAVRLSPDDWMVGLGADIWDQELRGRVEAVQAELAADTLGNGGSVVVEWGTWARSERDALLAMARERGGAHELAFLDPPLDVLWQRIEGRDRERAVGNGRAITRAELEEWSAMMQRPDAAELADWNGS